MSYAGRLPNRSRLLSADIFCKKEWRFQKAVPILVNRHGEPFEQREATLFLRKALVTIGGLSPEEAACYCLRGHRQGYLSYLHARNFGLEDIAKLAAHQSTETTTGYLRDAEGKQVMKRKKGAKRMRPSNRRELSAYLKSLPAMKIAENSAESFNIMRKVAQNWLKNGRNPDIVRRTDNASKDLAEDPFKAPKAWGCKWSFHSDSDRARYDISPKARTWGNNRRKTRGLLLMILLLEAVALIHLTVPLTSPLK